MANALRSLKRRMQRMEQQGFILPVYMYQIKSEKTASKYTREKIVEISKFRETYQGEERIVSGARGQELLQRESARKRSETIKKKKAEKEKAEKDRGLKLLKELKRKEEEENRVLSISKQFANLDFTIKRYFNMFRSADLSAMFEDVYESVPKTLEYMQYLLDNQGEVLANLQNAIAVDPSDPDSRDRAYRDWLDLITSGQPTNEQVELLGELEDSSEGGYTQ